MDKTLFAFAAYRLGFRAAIGMEGDRENRRCPFLAGSAQRQLWIRGVSDASDLLELLKD